MADMNRITDGVIRAFQDVPGIDSIVLGGSRATGTASTASDVDIGIYYDEPSFDLGLFKRRACPLDDGHRESAITDIGDWGPWINGGGWLKVDGTDVDILFRDTRKVSATVDICLNGGIAIDHQCGHPFGFVNFHIHGRGRARQRAVRRQQPRQRTKETALPVSRNIPEGGDGNIPVGRLVLTFLRKKGHRQEGRHVCLRLPLSLRHVPAACLVCRKRYVHAQ